MKKDFNEISKKYDIIILDDEKYLTSAKLSSKIQCKCKKCNSLINVSLETLTRDRTKHGKKICKTCANKEKWIKKVTDKCGFFPYVILSEFKNATTPLKVQCKKCNKIFFMKPYTIFSLKEYKNNNRYACRTCFKRSNNITCVNTVKDAYDLLYKKFNVVDYEFINKRDEDELSITEHIDIKCLKCNNVFHSSLFYLLNPTSKSKRYCSNCNNIKQSYNKYNYLTKYNEITNNTIIPTEKYQGAKKYINHKCLICGYGSNDEWLASPYSILKLNRKCPKCSNNLNRGTSKIEKEIYDYIFSLTNNCIQNYKPNFLKNNQEIDIFLPELKIGFEINGVYWHSLNKKKNNHSSS